MPGSTLSRCSRNCSTSVVPMSERQQLKLVRQLEINEVQRGNNSCRKETGGQRVRSKSCNGRGETPLHKAAIRGDEESVNKLLEEGADPNIPDFAGWTPLHEACNHGWYSIALALIEAGASVNARGLDDDTPLHDAAVNGHFKLVRLLIERGADLNSRNKGGKTPRDVAAPALMPHLLRFHCAEKKEVEKRFDLSGAHAHENDFTAASETLETTPQTKVEKNPKLTLKLHHIKKKSVEKSIFVEKTYSNSKFQCSNTMDEKSNKEDVYEFKSSKEATPVRGTSTSPEVPDKNISESKGDKAGDGYSGTEAESFSMKRTVTDLVETEDPEDEIKRKKRKESDGKVREETGISLKTQNSAGRTTSTRNVNSGIEKGGKTTGHTLCKNSGPASKAVLCNAGVSPNSDRKSPSSPKGSGGSAQHINSNASSNSAAKTEEPQEDKPVGDGEKMDQGPKVPPLKIVIPQQTASEPEQGNRNGKNGASRHHQALPYVVSSNSNDGEKEGFRSRSASPTDSFKIDEKKDPAIGMLSAEDQKSSLHHQRVLRSAHRSGPNSNGEGRAADTSVSRIGNSGSQNANSGASVTLSSTSNNANSGSISSNDNPSPQSQNRCSPLPQVDSNLSASVTSFPVSADSTPATQTASTYRSSSTTPSKSNGSSSNSTSTSCFDDKTSENNSESCQSTSAQTAVSNPAPVELHPRKRKLKHNKEVKEPSLPQVTTERCESTTASTEVHPHEQPVKNCYQLFLDIRRQIERRRKGLFPVQPKPPQGFKDYLMNRCTYVLAGNTSTRQIPSSPLPQNLCTPMKDLFSEQEKERHRLRLQHVIEKEKLVLSVEQEILRVHGRAARALANQSLPFSACTILKDEEVYNLITPEQEEKDRNARSRYNGRLFLSWLQDVDDKWEKIKEAMLLRHHNEAESLHAVQKMDWEWKMKEVGSCEFKSKPVILDSHVPMVHVSDDFDLLPA